MLKKMTPRRLKPLGLVKVIFKETKTMKNFDLVTFLLALAGRIQAKRHEKLVKREADLRAAITAAQDALQDTVGKRVVASWNKGDITSLHTRVTTTK